MSLTPPSWYSTHLRRVFFDMHLPDWTRPGQSGGQLNDLKGVATRFDPRAIIGQFAQAHVNVVVAYAKCQYGNFYYNTQIGHKHSGLGNLDLLGELTEEAHRHNIRIIGYYSNMWDTEVARAHPDWMKQDATGHTSYDRWPALCLNSPYRDLVQQHLHEMFSRYDLDGMWSDILSDLPCFCPRCQALYRGQFGRPMPRTPEEPGWIHMVRWQQDYLYDYICSTRAVIKALKPDAAYIVNFFGTPYAAPSQGLSFKHLALSDYGSSEGYSEWHGLLFPSYVARYLRAGKLDGPFEVLISRFESTWDFTVRPLEQMRFEAFSVVANGGAVCVDDEPYHDGQLEPLVYTHLTNIFGEIRRRESYVVGAVPFRFAALYHSQKAREIDEVLNPPKPLEISRTTFFPKSNHAPSDLLPSLMGAFKAFVEAHIPVQFVDDRTESLATLPRYRVVYLPNVLSLSEEEAERLREFVYQGGGLVATGATSLYDEWGRQRENFLLSDLFGVDCAGRGAFTYPYFGFVPGPITQDLTGLLLPHDTAMWQVVPHAADVQIAATRHDPLIETGGEVYYHNNKPAPGPDTGEPAIVYRQVGQGRVVYCAGLPENRYAVLGHVPYRRLIRNMVLWAARSAPPVRVEDLTNTELVTNVLGNDLIVHLITGMPQRSIPFGLRRTADTIEEQVPLYNVRLIIPPQTRQAKRVPQNEILPIESDGDQTWIMLPRVEDWETIQLAQ
jgi:hypothetical protein